MYQALTAQQTREIEAVAMRELGVSIAGLMELAGRAVADRVQEIAPRGEIVVLTGPGNNGGDGWVAARVLHEAGRDARVLAASEPTNLPEPAVAAFASAAAAGVRWESPSPAEAVVAFSRASLVVDSLFGFGVRGSLREPFASLVEALNDSDAPVLSVDLPSGVDSDTGASPGPAVLADHTLALMSHKVGHVQEPGRSLAGDVRVATLGVPSASLTAQGALEVWEIGDAAATLPVPDALDHKGSRGRVAVVGGSLGMSGAVVLAAWGALRMGAGYVTCAVPASVAGIVDAGVVPAVVLALPETHGCGLARDALEAASDLAETADSLVLGPGLGASAESRELARALLARVRCPIVLDADGLNAVAEDPSALAERRAPLVMTPHPGEAARLLGCDTSVVQIDRPSAARRLAEFADAVVLKGAGTLVASGDRIAAMTTGGPALATMGTGDVLAGAIGALLAQGVDIFEAACTAATVHGIAGEVASESLTIPGTTAPDVAQAMPAALARVLASGA